MNNFITSPARKTLIALAVAGSFSAPAFAVEGEFLGIRAQLDNRLTAGASWRMEARDSKRVGISNGGQAYSTNGDDGNLAFDNGDIVAAAFKLNSDLTLTRGNFGVFLRGSYLFDANLNDHDFFNRDNYAVGSGPGLTPTGRPSVAGVDEYNRRNKRVQDELGNNANLLDAYVFGTLPLGDRQLGFKIGRQVINWGESSFVLHGINSIMAYDANRQRVPGFELDELVIPTAMAWFSLDLTQDVAMEVFYQLDWEKTYLEASGGFWTTNDFVGPGGVRANITFGLPPENTPNTTIPRYSEREPGNDGQFGVKFSTVIDSLNAMNVGIYAMNYHSRLPIISGISKASYAAPSETGGFFLEYPEDIQLYGVSFSSGIGDWAIQGEYSYKVDQPLQVDDVELLFAGVGLPSQLTPPPAPPLGSALGGNYIRGFGRHDVSHSDVSITRLFGPHATFGYDQMLLLIEAGAVYVHDLPSQDVLRYEGPGTYRPGDPAVAALVSASTTPIFGQGVPVQTHGYATDFSWGYKIAARFTYNNVFNRFTVEPAIRYDHDVEGITPTPLMNFFEKRKSVTTSVTAGYMNAWSATLGYTAFFDGGDSNLLSDRDYLEAVLKYTF